MTMSCILQVFKANIVHCESARCDVIQHACLMHSTNLVRGLKISQIYKVGTLMIDQHNLTIEKPNNWQINFMCSE